MKLLICTQTVDKNDPVLGFFVRWIEEFEKYCEVEVVSLKTLGSGGRLIRAWRLLRLAMRLEYDAVFVHMNPEYLIAAGWLWRLLGKKTALWYAHGSDNLKLRVATAFVQVVLTSTTAGFRPHSKKVRIVGQGIDTNFFLPDPLVERGEHWLSVGRLTRSKRHDAAIAAAARAGKNLRIAGEGPERAHLEALARASGIRVDFLGPLTQVQLRDEYQRAALLIHRSETGSLDKVVLEAISCGLPVDSTDPQLGALPLNPADPAYVCEHHSLQKLIPAILAELA